jgi:hypothetical protein
MNRRTGRDTDKKIDRWTDRETDKQIDRETDRWTEIQMKRQTDGQTVKNGQTVFQPLDVAACDGPVRFHRVVNVMADDSDDKVSLSL